MDTLVAGDAGPAASLVEALREHGLAAGLYDSTGAASGTPHSNPGERSVERIADAAVELERRLAAERPTVAIAVGLGDVPLALALGAAKLGTPLAAWLDVPSPTASALEENERRILSELSGLEHPGPVAAGAEATAAAERISAWAHLDLRA